MAGIRNPQQKQMSRLVVQSRLLLPLLIRRCPTAERLPLSLVSFRRRIRRCDRGLAEVADDLGRRVVARLAEGIRAREMRLHEFGDQLEAPALGRPRSKIVAEQQHGAKAAELLAHALDLVDRVIRRADDRDLFLERGSDDISRVTRDRRRRWDHVVCIIVEFAKAPRGIGHRLLASFGDVHHQVIRHLLRSAICPCFWDSSS